MIFMHLTSKQFLFMVLCEDDEFSSFHINITIQLVPIFNCCGIHVTIPPHHYNYVRVVVQVCKNTSRLQNKLCTV